MNPSIVMMESSTIMPSTAIRAARETILTCIPVKNIRASATAMQTGTPELAMSAERIGKSSSITRITTSIEISRSRMKDMTERWTTLGWSVMRLRCTDSGAEAENSASTRSTSWPKSTILLSGRIVTLSTSAVWPL